MVRDQVSDSHLLTVIELFVEQLGKRLEKHGRGKYASAHETLGIVAEEYDELLDAVRKNDPQLVYEELMDIAVGCIFGVASMTAEQPVESNV